MLYQADFFISLTVNVVLCSVDFMVKFSFPPPLSPTLHAVRPMLVLGLQLGACWS